VRLAKEIIDTVVGKKNKGNS